MVLKRVCSAAVQPSMTQLILKSLPWWGGKRRGPDAEIEAGLQGASLEVAFPSAFGVCLPSSLAAVPADWASSERTPVIRFFSCRADFVMAQN
jgi:hypothetical protein